MKFCYEFHYICFIEIYSLLVAKHLIKETEEKVTLKRYLRNFCLKLLH